MEAEATIVTETSIADWILGQGELIQAQNRELWSLLVPSFKVAVKNQLGR